ncbi:MAG: transporter substrate-binding domain-containing protein [Pseudomonadota bacterium]
MKTDTPGQFVIAGLGGFQALLLGLCMLLAPGAGAREQVVVFDSTETPPVWSSSLTGGGMGGELLRLLSDEAGVTFSINYLPPARFRNSTSANIVGNPNLLKTERNRAIFPIGVLHLAYVYYTPHHPALQIASLADLSGHTLGVLRGTVENRAQFASFDINVEEADSIESLLRMLQRGRIDLAVMVEVAGKHHIRQTFPEHVQDFAVTRIPGTSLPITMMVDLDSTDGRELARRYRLALEKTVHTPQYDAILRKYHGQDPAHLKADRELLDRLMNLYESTWDE